MSVARKHLALLKATLDQTRVSLELLAAQVASFEAFVQATEAPAARVELPARCANVDEAKCALRNEEAQLDHSSLTHPNRWMCDGCDVMSDSGVGIN